MIVELFSIKLCCCFVSIISQTMWLLKMSTLLSNCLLLVKVVSRKVYIFLRQYLLIARWLARRTSYIITFTQQLRNQLYGVLWLYE